MLFSVEGTQEVGFVDNLVDDVASALAAGALQSRELVEAEIDVMLSAVRSFWNMEPDQVLLMCSAMSARCAELATHLHRLEGRREWLKVRTMQVERLHDELDRQFKIHSRLIEVRRQDLDMTRGAR